MKLPRRARVPIGLLTLLFVGLVTAPRPGLARQPVDFMKLGDRARYNLSPKQKQKGIFQYGLKAMALRRSFLKTHNTSYTVEIPGAPGGHRIRNQFSTGRCWIYAMDRVLQSKLTKRGVDAPELSTSFVNYHSLRQQSHELLDIAAIGGKLVPAKAVKLVSEGGWEPWASDIIKKHGFMPKQKMDSGVDGHHSAVYLNQLQTLLSAAQRDLGRVQPGEDAKAQRKAIVRSYKKQVDQLLDATLGKPAGRFRYEGKRYTPRTFAEKYLKLKPEDLDFVILSNDTTKAWNRRFQCGPSIGADKFEVYNVSLDTMKRAVKRTIRGGEAVWVGTNVSGDNPYRVIGAESEHLPEKARGIASIRAFNYGEFIPQKGVSKTTRLRSGVSPTNHAMAIVGYDTGGKRRGHARGDVLKWKVENSWGKDAGDGGFWHMYDKFFDQYTGMVAVPRSSVSKTLLKQIESKPLAGKY